jgi:hypothetical protein
VPSLPDLGPVEAASARRVLVLLENAPSVAQVLLFTASALLPTPGVWPILKTAANPQPPKPSRRAEPRPQGSGLPQGLDVSKGAPAWGNFVSCGEFSKPAASLLTYSINAITISVREDAEDAGREIDMALKRAKQIK